MQFKTVDDAVRTREALFNLQWPALGGKHLVVSFVAESEVKSRVTGAAVPPSPNAAAVASRSAAKEEPPKGTAGQRVVLPVKERLTLPIAEKPAPLLEGKSLSLCSDKGKVRWCPVMSWRNLDSHTEGADLRRGMRSLSIRGLLSLTETTQNCIGLFSVLVKSLGTYLHDAV